MKDILKKIKDRMTPKNNHTNISLKDFANYCKSHSLLITITILILALAHGTNIFYNNFGIDTQMFIEDPSFTYNWLGIGRFGLLVERFLLGLTWFSPYYAGVLFFLFLVLSNVILYYTFYKISKKDFGLINLCIPLIAFTSPIWVEQFVYMLQYAEIACSIFLTALATLFIFTWIKNNNYVYAVFGIACLIISFASYQSFVALYIAFCIFGFLLLFEDAEERFSSFQTICKLIITFAISFLGYKIIAKILPSNTLYIDDSFLWGKESLRTIYEFITGHIKAVLKGEGNYYNLGYSISAILFAILIIYKIYKTEFIEKKSNKIWYILSAIAFLGTPFYMIIAIGHSPFIRAQIILPFTVAFLILFVSYYLWKQKWLKYIAVALVLYVFGTQIFMTETLYYTDQMRNKYDIQTAEEIIHDMGELGIVENAELAIIGYKSAHLNPVCKVGETVGVSIFSMNYSVPPYYINSSSMIIRLFKCLGYTYRMVSEPQMLEARREAIGMPEWPAEGSIKEYNGYVIVKLSHDTLPLE